jgi:hypothetical protein
MAPATSEKTGLETVLSTFTDVHAGEGMTAVLLALNVFLILMA